jgi:YebC/PmpR family DNA-binding regulatory protein
MLTAKRLVAFAVGVSLSQAFDGSAPRLSLRACADSLGFAAPAANSLWAGKSGDAKCTLPATVKNRVPSAARMSPLMMGRAAAVRAVTKGKTDAAKAKLNARYGKQIAMLIKQGGSDLIANRPLAKLMEQAKAAGVPKANMDNMIKKAQSKDAAEYKEVTFEAYANGGVGFVITVLTDNNNRASADVKTVINKQKLKLAESGSVAFNFDRLGQVTVLTDKDEDTMTEAALTAGAEDLQAIETEEKKDQGFLVYTQPGELMSVADALSEAGYTVKGAEFIYKGQAPIDVNEADEEANFKALDALEELDDVDAVFHNMA